MINGRYRVDQEIGRGGMAVVYRVDDIATGKPVALKQLVPPSVPRHAREVTDLFEREFHTLAQLSHPHVIAVYDYGLNAAGPYYTMELLDGGDLRSRSPLPWRDACSLMFDVCSSLALLHSRRLVHRDISPRNVRCTRDGSAKLIDFGALVPVGVGGRPVGTPPYAAPEVVHRLTIDARTDLFSVGATLYYALTGRHAYRARTFDELPQAWSNKPAPPSSIAPDVPPALDALVLSLLSLEPALRPRNAYEVMQRLAVVAEISRIEPLGVVRAYLSAPSMIGRDSAMDALRRSMTAAAAGSGGGALIRGIAGVGRSRVLDASALAAKTLGATVLRAGAAEAAGGDLALMCSLGDQLLEALPASADATAAPELVSTLFEEAATVSGLSMRSPDATNAIAAGAFRDAFKRWFADVAASNFVAIAVDDVHRLDERSTALIAALVYQAERTRAFCMLTLDNAIDPAASPTLRVLAAQCAALELQPLNAEQTHALVESVFGDVPNVALVSARVHEVARGNPRQTMDLLGYLVDKATIAYDGGKWSLPASLNTADMPSSAVHAFREQTARLTEPARFIAEAQALASHETFTREDYVRLCADREPQAVHAALSELVSSGLLTGDGRVYVLASIERAAALTGGLSPERLEQLHRALASMYEHDDNRRVAAVHHWLSSGEHERALDALASYLAHVEQRGGLVSAAAFFSPRWMGAMLDRALDAAERARRRPREINFLRASLAAVSVATDESYYFRAAPSWRAQLERDSGLTAYRESEHITDEAARLKHALECTIARFVGTPESERVFSLEEAIRGLVQYVAISIVIGARTHHPRIVAELPDLLAPFTSLSPLVEAMSQNAVAAFEVNFGALPERARERVTRLYERLAPFTEAELPNVGIIRNSLAYCAGAIEANFGLLSATQWAQILEQDAMQQVNAMHIRKTVRMQQGDAEGAERCRKQAELLGAQASFRQMFPRSFAAELSAYSTAHDLTGVKQVLDAVSPLAARWPGWIAFKFLAEGHFERIRGNLDAALDAYQRCLTLCSPDPADPLRSIGSWPRATASVMELELELGRPEQARTRGEEALAVGAQLELGVALHDVSRVLALCEARLNEYGRAMERLSALVDAQKELRITGLNLGASYEVCARIAVWANDGAAAEHYGRLTAREYRHGRGSPLGARYERLMDEARRAGVLVLPELSEFELTVMATTATDHRLAAQGAANAVRGAQEPKARAGCALALICDARGAREGHLYLLCEEALVLVASSSGYEPQAGMHEFATTYLNAERQHAEMLTVFGGGTAETTRARRLAFMDPRGATYNALLLACSIAGRAHCAGVALLRVEDGRKPKEDAGDVLAAVASCLIEIGDARGAIGGR